MIVYPLSERERRILRWGTTAAWTLAIAWACYGLIAGFVAR